MQDVLTAIKEQDLEAQPNKQSVQWLGNARVSKIFYVERQDATSNESNEMYFAYTALPFFFLWLDSSIYAWASSFSSKFHNHTF
jgi:hypothetical protein